MRQLKSETVQLSMKFTFRVGICKSEIFLKIGNETVAAGMPFCTLSVIRGLWLGATRPVAVSVC
jgi:hypothetical protein